VIKCLITNFYQEEAMTTTTKRALIVVDVQNDFANATTGSLYVFGGEAVAKRIGELLHGDLSEYALVVSTQDWHLFPGDHWSASPDFVNTWPVRWPQPMRAKASTSQGAAPNASPGAQEATR
jgi:nicotinamidase-related amidase